MKKLKLLFMCCILIAGLLISGCDTDNSSVGDPPAGDDSTDSADEGLSEQSLFTAGTDISKHLGDGAFIQAATGAEGTGTTSYSSSAESVAAVDPESGEVYIIGMGVTTITASNTGDSTYQSVSDSYVLEVFDSRFIMTWQLASDELADQVFFTIGTNDSSDCDVDWGDGNSETFENGDITHSYSTAGTYTVTIAGNMSSINLPMFSGDSRLQTLENWGSSDWTSMYHAFENCSSLIVNAEDIPDFSQLTDTEAMFLQIDAINSDINNWDMSAVTTMSQMFSYVTSFNQDISGWDVSNVTNFGYMFQGASAFNQDISGWDVSKAENMDRMFENAAAFSGHDLSGWVVSNVSQHDQFSSGWGGGNTEPVWP